MPPNVQEQVVQHNVPTVIMSVGPLRIKSALIQS